MSSNDSAGVQFDDWVPRPGAPYSSAAGIAYACGWPPIILPKGAKSPPEKYRTGWDGVDATVEQIQAHLGAYGVGGRNVGLRAPENVVGFDVDNGYRDKHTGQPKPGGQTLAELEGRLGALPDTVMSTARPGSCSGILWFRVPPGTVLTGILGPGIEVVQRHHRYAAAPPSKHPDTGTTAGWFRHRGNVPAKGWPVAATLPDLPPAWLAEFARDTRADRKAVTLRVPGPDDTYVEVTVPRPPVMLPDHAAVTAWLTVHGRYAQPCPRLGRVLDEVDFTDGTSRYAAMIAAQWVLVLLATAGHNGGRAALVALHDRYIDAVGVVIEAAGSVRDTEGEWFRGLSGAIGKITADPPELRTCTCLLTTGGFRRTRRVVLDNEVEYADTVIESLAARDPSLTGIFRKGDQLVTVLSVGQDGWVEPPTVLDRHGNPITDPDGPTQLHRLGADGLHAELYQRWVTVEVSITERGEEVETIVWPPSSAMSVAATVAPRWPSVPVLRGVVHVPTVDVGGRFVTAPGWDADTGIVLIPAPGVADLVVPAYPTADQVRSSLQRLDRLLRHFPWADGYDRISALAMLITPAILPFLDGPPPLMLICAPRKGSGKTLLMSTPGNLYGGWVQRGPLPGDDAELRKQITSVLLTTTAPIVGWDNVRGPILFSTLESLLTAERWSDRILGESRDTGGLSTKRLWMVTANNPVIAGDLDRRLHVIRLVPTESRPWLRTGLPDLPAHIAANRGELIGDVLTLIAAWLAKGCPDGTRESGRSDSFGNWEKVIGGILEVAGTDLPLGRGESNAQVASEDEVAAAALVDLLVTTFGTRPFVARELIDIARTPNRDRMVEALPESVVALLFTDSDLAARQLGRELRKVAGQVHDGWSLQAMRRTGRKHGATTWVMVGEGDFFGGDVDLVDNEGDMS